MGRPIDEQHDAVVVVARSSGGELGVDYGEVVAAGGGVVLAWVDQLGVADVAVAADFGGYATGSRCSQR
jgi:hypothetical protein